MVAVTVGGEKERKRERERLERRWETQFWVFRSKPSFTLGLSVEIVHAIEASNRSFVWVVGKTFICYILHEQRWVTE